MAFKPKRSIGFPASVSLKSRKIPLTTLILIVVNIVVYALTSYENFFLEVNDYWVNLGGFIPALITAPSQIYRIFTSMFLHADFFHLLFNMYFLYLFGRTLEDTLGEVRFLALYFASGFAASIFHTAFSFLGGSTAHLIPAIGASGAISGILGAYLILYPGTSLVMGWFFFVFPLFVRVKASYYLLFWFATQLLYGYARAEGSTAVFAHAGGFIAGIALLLLVANKERISQFKMVQRLNLPLYWIFAPPKTGGLSRTTKIVVSALLASLLAGATYASLGLADQGNVKSTILQYALEGTFYTDYVGIRLPNVEADVQSVSLDTTRILLNRLYAAELIYDGAKASKTVNLSLWSGELPIRVAFRVVYVNTTVYDFNGKYDSEGFLEYGEGTLTTHAVSIQVYGNIYQVVQSEPITYDFRLASQTVNLTNVTRYTAVPSVVLTAIALAVVAKKDRDFAVIGEEPETARRYFESYI